MEKSGRLRPTGRKVIRAALEAAMSERELQVVGLLNYYGFSEEEVGALFGITRARVFQINQRAIEKIREIYRRHGVRLERDERDDVYFEKGRKRTEMLRRKKLRGKEAA